jgi:D-3-phosphoglycerate dehydrogenase
VPRILNGPLTRALIVENPSTALDPLLEHAGFEVERVNEPPDEDTLIRLLRDGRHQVLFKRSRVQVSRRVVENAPELVAVQLCSIGDDSVDKQACAEAGVLVFNDPISNGRSVVELVIGHLIAMSRRLYETNTQTHEGYWEKSNRERYEVRGKVLGMVGLGNIGRAAARAAEALGMKILFYDTREVAQEIGMEMGWEEAETLEALFRGSDMVSLHVSANDHRGDSNEGFITRELLMSLGADRPESSPRLFLNLARGVLLDPADLRAAVDAGRIRQAAVDVYPEEPRGNGPGWENPYADEPRVICTPHMGAATQEAQPRIARRVASTMRSFSHFCAIRDCVMGPKTRISFADDGEGGAILSVVHADTRGTKKALDDAIYEAEASNLRSQHRDFKRWGVAVDVNLLDRPLSDAQLQRIVERTAELTGDPNAVRLVRQIKR